MKKCFNVALFVALLFAAGCVSHDQVIAGNYGPIPENYQETAKKFFWENLKDPMSAQYEFLKPQKGWIKDGLIQGGKMHFGWFIPVRVNAKNSFGGYTGFETHHLFISEGMVWDATALVRVNRYVMWDFVLF